MSRGSGFKAKAPPRREARQIDYVPRPRATVVVGPELPMASPVLKFPYVRDTRFQSMCRAMACQHCWAAGADAGVTWAHSNQERHGKGGAVKASDQFVAALCAACHAEVDQGKRWTWAEKVAVWDAAFWRTVREALARGLWPTGVPVPEPW